MSSAPPRSYLFVPGDRPERFDKACAAGAGMVIVDLEDAVAPQDKRAARDAVAGWLRPEQTVALRINATDTAWFDDDLALCRLTAGKGVAAIVLPKAETVEQLQRLSSLAPDAALLPLIETARGLANAQALAEVTGVQRLVFGSIDFQLDMGISGEGEELLAFRSQLVLVSRLAGVAAPVDGVSTALDDVDQLRADTQRARRLGFGAKLCIHPKQVGIVNAAFAPTQQEIDWARRVLDAAQASQGAAVAVDGKMVDKPVILRARMVLGLE